MALWLVALYEFVPMSNCSMGMMKLPFMLGIVPPITGVLTLPTFFLLAFFETKNLSNKLVQTLLALVIQLPLSFVIAALVTPIDGGMMWECMLGL